MARRVGHFTEVGLRASAFVDLGVSASDFPVTVTDNIIRLGAACRKYVVDEFHLPEDPAAWPEPLPPAVEHALVNAVAIAEHWNVSTGRRGKKALVFCDDLAHALGDDPNVINARYRAAAARPSDQNPLEDVLAPVDRARTVEEPASDAGEFVSRDAGAVEADPAPEPSTGIPASSSADGRFPNPGQSVPGSSGAAGVRERYAVGDRIGGRFEVLEVIGAGGFSTVYRVSDAIEGREWALKLFESAKGDEAVRREIGALREVNHPNVVRVIWTDRTDLDEWYLVMELVEGESLADYASGDKRLSDRQAVDCILDVLNALIALHPDADRLRALDAKSREDELTEAEFEERMLIKERSIVHRDVKPHNVVLTRSGAKLLDFNIASRYSDPVRTVSGTPPYQPPGADLTQWDVSTDLFAVGVTLYQLLCGGEHPYPNARPFLDVEVRDPRQFRPDLDPDLAEYLVTACRPDRAKRFQTAVEMRDRLEEIRAAV